MIPHQTHKSTRSNHFSFSNSLQRDEVTQFLSSLHNMTDYNTWAEGIKSNYTRFGNTENRNHGAWTSRIPPNSIPMQFDCKEEFRWLAKREDSDSDNPSPSLWQNSPTHENLYSVRSNDDKFGNYPTRTQEIAGYKKEMIDMVRELPETAYELSLRDIVEKKMEFEEIKPVKEKPKTKKDKKKVVKKNPNVSRSKSLDTGLLIKMFLPLSVGRRMSFNGLFRDKNEHKEEVNGKEKKIERNKFKDEEWWKKNEFSEEGSSEASSSSSSSYHSGSSRGYNISRSGSRKRNGCYSFFRRGKIRNRTSSRE